MAAGDLRDWNKGDRASATHLQEGVSALKTILSLPGSEVGRLRGGPSGRGRVFDLMIGKIVSGSYTDERYMVTAQYVLGTSLTSDQITTSDLTAVDTEQVTFTVTNLAELAGHTHTLAEGMTVLFMAVYDAAEDANRHYVMCVAGRGALLPVALTQTGGAIGNQTTASSWTYTVKDITNTTTLLTGASPLVSRPNGRLTAASYGTGYYAPDGSGFVLFRAEEIEDTGGC